MSKPNTHPEQWQHRPLIEEDAANLELSAHEAIGLAAQVFPCIFAHHMSLSNEPKSNEAEDNKATSSGRQTHAGLLRKASEDAVRAVMEMVTAVRTAKAIYDADTLPATAFERAFKDKERKILKTVMEPILKATHLLPGRFSIRYLREAKIPLISYLRVHVPDKLLPQRLRPKGTASPGMERKQDDYRKKVFTDFYLVRRSKGEVRVEPGSVGFKMKFLKDLTPVEILEQFKEGIAGADIVSDHDDFTAFVGNYRAALDKYNAAKAGAWER